MPARRPVIPRSGSRKVNGYVKAVQALEARTRGADETLARENQELRKRIEALERLIQRQ
jgi:hypothetical protein